MQGPCMKKDRLWKLILILIHINKLHNKWLASLLYAALLRTSKTTWLLTFPYTCSILLHACAALYKQLALLWSIRVPMLF